MDQTTNAVTVIAARFDHLLGKGADTSVWPKGATLATAGTEVNWDTPDGFPRRARKIRIWIAIWPSQDTAQSYLDARTTHLPLLAEGVESLALLGVPFAVHGEVNWSPDGKATSLYPDLGQRPHGDGPVMVMTSLGLGDPRNGLVDFGKGVAQVRAAFAQNPAVLADINMLADLPSIDGPTLTLWRSERELMAGAYRSDPHRSVMSLRNGATARASFTRMAVMRAEGSWNGRDLETALSR